MAESKEEYLNQPYYGPPIPYSQTTLGESHRANPEGSKSKFDAYSLLCTFTKIATIFIIIIGIIVLVIWLVYQPQSIKIYAESASLSSFNLSSTGNSSHLTYNLAVNFTFRNPNQKYSIYYQLLHAHAYFGKYQIGFINFPRMHQGRKSSMPVDMRFEGGEREPEIARDESAVHSYNREKAGGFFSVRLKMYVTVRLKMVLVKSVKFKPDVDCYLSIPAPGNATSSAVGFARTECDVYNFS